jgi:hypothetical protein
VKMHKDPIVEGVRKHRDEIAGRFGYNIRPIAEDARKRERTSGHKLVSFCRRKTGRIAPAQAVQKAGGTTRVALFVAWLAADSASNAGARWWGRALADGSDVVFPELLGYLRSSAPRVQMGLGWVVSLRTGATPALSI